MGRDTRTGAMLEAMVLHPLKLGGYEYEPQVLVGQRPGGRLHKVDAVAWKDEKRFLVSLKWQQVSGAAEQKVPFEIICLLQALRESPNYTRAYLVLGGEGWTLRDYFVSGQLSEYIPYTSKILVLTLEKFTAMASKGNL
jgi:hypothetical protein